jgi:hypothetical protein
VNRACTDEAHTPNGVRFAFNGTDTGVKLIRQQPKIPYSTTCYTEGMDEKSSKVSKGKSLKVKVKVKLKVPLGMAKKGPSFGKKG